MASLPHPPQRGTGWRRAKRAASGEHEGSTPLRHIAVLSGIGRELCSSTKWGCGSGSDHAPIHAHAEEAFAVKSQSMARPARSWDDGGCCKSLAGGLLLGRGLYLGSPQRKSLQHNNLKASKSSVTKLLNCPVPDALSLSCQPSLWFRGELVGNL